MQAAGRHGPFEGEGKIATNRKGKQVSLDYSYKFSEGAYRGSISLWDPDDADMGMLAYMSRELPTRDAMIEWIFEKAVKLTTDEE